ncbi:hypothetical protein CYD53_101138 [Bosea psychrotolerans]|uniref:Uncharacterized protein n=1 Tax=Bosea psychrotolerans TaxID=1871628 RepID=A0A2S4MQN8_9HYPH|nr:hypothetical protein CYD53_101138 [Bosea psychrotolerans]
MRKNRFPLFRILLLRPAHVLITGTALVSRAKSPDPAAAIMS